VSLLVVSLADWLGKLISTLQLQQGSQPSLYHLHVLLFNIASFIEFNPESLHPLWNRRQKTVPVVKKLQELSSFKEEVRFCLHVSQIRVRVPVLDTTGRQESEPQVQVSKESLSKVALPNECPTLFQEQKAEGPQSRSCMHR
jgi:hypothetical protein